MYKVFFVDDEAAMRAGIRENIDWNNSIFTLAGEAPDGEMALSLMQDIMPDILITDVRMPFMDGIELARRTRKAMPWVKIIILSGHDEFEYAQRAISIGVEDYLLKPVTSVMLIEALNKIAVRIEEEKEKFNLINRNQIISAGSKYNDIVAKAQEYIQKNYHDESISLHSIAKEVNVSPNHLSAIFSQETGETFINYVTRIRLEHAKILLKTANIRTSEVGYEVGYNDTHYFSHVFKKNVGMTPKEYRNRSRM